MALWSRFISSAEQKYHSLRNTFRIHESAAKEKLLTNHPHLGTLLQKHNIDLKKIRTHGPQIAVAATILGAFLAFPHLVGKPQKEIITQTEIRQSSNPKGHPSTPAQKPDSKNEQTPTGREPTSNNPPSSGQSQKPKEDNSPKSPDKSQGHQYGRSRQAPPKDHELHDLGLHKGETKNEQVPEIGPHPIEIEVVKKDKKEVS